MPTIRERIERRIFRLRLDDRFDDLLTEQLSHTPEVNKLVLTGKVDVEALREYALRAIEVAYLREEDSEHELPEARYEEHVNRLVRECGELVGVHTEQREAFRAWLRYVHGALRSRMSRDAAWRTFASVAPSVVRAIVDLHRALLPILVGMDDDTDGHS